MAARTRNVRRHAKGLLSGGQRRSGLAGAVVAVTRPAGAGEKLSAMLERGGAVAFRAPAIRRAPPRSWKGLDAGISDLLAGRFDGVLFTSPAAVEAFFARLFEQGDVRELGGRLLCAVGAATAGALADRGIRADVVSNAGGEALAAAIVERLGEELPGSVFLLPRAAGGREELATALEEAGAAVTTVDAYRTLPAEAADLEALRDALDGAEVDAVTFASPSAVQAVAKVLGKEAGALLGGTRLVAIGSTTAAALEALRLPVAAVAATPSDEALVRAVRKALGKPVPAGR